MSRTPKEAIYDEKINPLMAEIIKLCKEHKIAMLADFSLGEDPENGETIKCTTVLLEDEHEPGREQRRAANILYGGHTITMLTVRDAEGNVKSKESSAVG